MHTAQPTHSLRALVHFLVHALVHCLLTSLPTRHSSCHFPPCTRSLSLTTSVSSALYSLTVVHVLLAHSYFPAMLGWQIMDRDVIARQLLTNAVDPFTRRPLSINDVQPLPELRERISTWVGQRLAAAASQRAAVAAAALAAADDGDPTSTP